MVSLRMLAMNAQISWQTHSHSHGSDNIQALSAVLSRDGECQGLPLHRSAILRMYTVDIDRIIWSRY